jgi:pimeloyl-ACP methyl ester carboxylesterase
MFLSLALFITLLQSQQPVDRFATVNGLRIHYLEWGSSDKQPLIMLHGIGRIAHTFDHIAPHFASRYHVMAVDMRGHGDSAWILKARIWSKIT